ncbi:MAG TPA: DUF2786 domain-containing protein [Kofleriaceae bacterium]
MDPERRPDDLAADLEAALLRELMARFENENYLRFGEKLTPPVFALVDSAQHLGRWVPAGRRIEIARSFVLARSWQEVLSVLQHEMAHQYVDEVLGVRDETPHGETFRTVCAERGIDGRAGGAPVPADGQADRVLDRIRKLLALAGSDNMHEAEGAMQRAHELMLRYNVDAAATARTYTVRHLGDPAKRRTRVESSILALLAELFFVKAIIVPTYVPRLGKRGSVYEISGTPANVDMAEHVFGFLLATADRLWRENRGDSRVRSGRDRLAYQDGVIRGFREKLLADRTAFKGTGLVWIGDADLDRYYATRHPRIVTRRTMATYNGAHAAGREAGRTVVLHKPVTSATNTGRLLR